MYSDGVYTRPLSQLTGIHGPSIENLVSVFPNPSGNELTVQNRSEQQIQFTLYNLLGEKLIDQIITGKTRTINLSALSSDVYFYNLSNDKRLLNSGKIIKQ
jgi:hypothetical protein